MQHQLRMLALVALLALSQRADGRRSMSHTYTRQVPASLLTSNG